MSLWGSKMDLKERKKLAMLGLKLYLIYTLMEGEKDFAKKMIDDALKLLKIIQILQNFALLI